MTGHVVILKSKTPVLVRVPGVQGPAGPKGADGVSTLPAGGNTDDVLTKRSATNNDATWQPPRIPWASTNW